MPQELYSLNAVVLSPSQQALLLKVLLWLAHALCVGVAAWFLSMPRHRPSLGGVLTVGVLGGAVGIFLWTWLMQIEPSTFNPFSVAGGLASVITGVFLIWGWRLWCYVNNKPRAASINL
ncbi:MAG: hypothetical protein ACRC46_04705 [Thermoguttaceae bacterium]